MAEPMYEDLMYHLLELNDGDSEASRVDYVLIHNGKPSKEREEFYNVLLSKGIVVTEADDPIDDGIHVTKIHLPYNYLLKCAEELKLCVPLKRENLKHLLPLENKETDSFFEEEVMDVYETVSKSVFRTVCFPCRIRGEYEHPGSKEDAGIREYTAPFRMEYRDKFNIKSKNEFIYSSLRVYMAQTTLTHLGLNKLINGNFILDAFPLHDGPLSSDKEGQPNERARLYDLWASPKMFYKFQPLELIRRYFGEKIGLYFAWLGFYTEWLIPVALLGILVMLYGVSTISTNAYSKEICNRSISGNMWLCPSCDKFCPYQALYDSCTLSKLTSLFENEGIIILAIVMSCWGKLYLEFWRRKERELQCEWDVENFKTEQKVRKEYEECCTEQRKNPITGQMEPYMRKREKYLRIVISFTVVIFMVCVVMVAITGVIIYRTIIKVLLNRDDTSRTYSKLVTSITAGTINLTLIMALNKVYTRLAIFLTTWERPRTESEFDKKLTLKIYLFQFFNNYSSLFYIAFFKGNFVGHPSRYSYGLSERPEECDPSGCLMELSIQMIIVFCGKQMFNNIKEILVPVIKNCIRERKRRRRSDNQQKMLVKPQWEEDYSLLPVDHLSLFEEYLEMVVQFGFVALFVSAFPLAPLFAFINNIMEIRLDAFKMLTQNRRPPIHRNPTIGIWYRILKSISKIAILTNALIIAYTTNFIPKFLYRHFYNPHKDMRGIANFTLSVFDVSDFAERSAPDRSVLDEDTYNITHCFYTGFHEPPSSPRKYEYSDVFWRVAFSRILFVVFFEHIVTLLVATIAAIIPNVSQRVKIHMGRKQYLNGQLIYQKITA